MTIIYHKQTDMIDQFITQDEARIRRRIQQTERNAAAIIAAFNAELTAASYSRAAQVRVCSTWAARYPSRR
jgi:hypothetical protein